MNKDKIIKDLKERNRSLNNQYRLRDIRCVHLENKVQEQEKEIEIKKETINVMIDNEEKYCLEINRLNNIIKELEQELIKKIEAVKTIKDTLGEGAYVLNPHIDLLEQEYNYFYKKLQELKGVDKE